MKMWTFYWKNGLYLPGKKPTLSLDSTVCIWRQHLAEILSKFFTSTFTKESLDDIPVFQDQGFSTILDDILIDADIVKENYVV